MATNSPDRASGLFRFSLLPASLRLSAGVLIVLLLSLHSYAAHRSAPARHQSANSSADFAASVCGWKSGDSILTIPAGIKKIPAYAFADMAEITDIRIEGRALVSVGEYAFLGCASLKKITLPESVTELGEGCFRECIALRSLRIPEGVRKLPRFMCEWDSLLSEVSLPAALEDIGSHAFAYCSSLGKIDIPARVTHIGSNTFSYCTSLREVKVPDSVLELESYAFSECVALERAELPANDRLLGELIFSGCRNLRELIELSPVPPEFDCESFIFEPDEEALYSACRLVTLPASGEAYARAPGWCLFFR